MCLPLFCNGTVLFCEASSNGQVYLDQLDVSELKTENNQVMINYTLDQLIPFRHYNITIKIFDPEKNIIVQENSIICKNKLYNRFTYLRFCSYSLYTRF